MQLIPAMELNHGQCVHSRSDAESEGKKIVSEDPLAVVSTFVNEGAKRIHVVDVEAVISGEPENVNVVRKIKQQFPELDIQVAGNVKKEEHVYVWLDAGASFVILSSQASKRRSLIEDICIEFPNQIMAALETKNGQLCGSGTSKLDFYQRAIELEENGICGIVYTDVPASGRVNGNNIASAGLLANHVEIPVIANGGFNQLEDISSTCQEPNKLAAVIVGKPIYDKKFSFKDARDTLENNKASATV